MPLSVLTVVSCCALVGGTVSPFAVFGDVTDAALIAGAFSTVNVILNALMIQYLRRTRGEVQDVKQVTDKVKLRRGDRDTDEHPAEVEQ